jgi:hypothetical protein
MVVFDIGPSTEGLVVIRSAYILSIGPEGRPVKTIGVPVIPSMQSGICFNGPGPIPRENERKS